MVSMSKGPVLSNILDLINWGQKRGEPSPWLEYVSAPDGYDVKVARVGDDFDELSDRDRRILDEIDAEYGKVEKWSLVELTHELPEWRDPRGSSIPIDPAEILRHAGRSEHEIEIVAEDAEQALLIQELGRVALRPRGIRRHDQSHHLFVICSNPQPDGRVVAFNLTSREWNSDLTCVIKVGEHKYVTRESVIAYGRGELLTSSHIARMEILEPQSYGPVSSELLLRIQKGAIDSPETISRLKAIIKRMLNSNEP